MASLALGPFSDDSKPELFTITIIASVYTIKTIFEYD
jgi:hypothetical protein